MTKVRAIGKPRRRSRRVIKCLAIVAALMLVVACNSAATPTPEPTATMRPTPTPAPTATPTPTATPVPPTEVPERIAQVADPRLDALRETMESVEPVWTVYFHSDDWQTPGRNTLMNDVFELLKMENIATHEGYQPISPEVILDLEPDIIVADSVSSVVLDPALSGLHMVQDPSHIRHHIFVLSDDYSFSIDSPHFLDALEEFAAFVYPDVFAEEEEAADGHSHENGGGHSH